MRWRADWRAASPAADSVKWRTSPSRESGVSPLPFSYGPRIKEWMRMNEGKVWESYSEMAAQAANYAECSSVTSDRWIHQLSRFNAPWKVLDRGGGTVSVERREEPPA